MSCLPPCQPHGAVTAEQHSHAVPGHSLTVSVVGALAGGGRSGMAELGPGPGVRESRGGEEEEGLEVGALATESVCAERKKAASAMGPGPGAALPAPQVGQQPPHPAGWKELLDGAGQGLATQGPSPLPLAHPHSPHRCKCLMQALGHPKVPQPCSAHQHKTPRTHLLLP